jgi:cytochrome oxidase Cu insertion factor (SCO1/SenC/PrrC family)
MKWILIIALVSFLAVGTIPASGHGTESHVAGNAGDPQIKLPRLPAITAKAVSAADAEEKARRYFTDLSVVSQDGKEMRFFSDVLKDRVVLVSLFYTNCTGMCPINNAKLAEVQDLLGDSLGRNIFLVSVTLDPETDTPEVLKDYASKFEAKEGWLFLTGEKDDIKKITYRLGQTSPQIETHNPLFMLGNVGAAHWSKLRPNVPAEAVAARLRLMADDSPAN